jgi:hypothetical protein
MFKTVIEVLGGAVVMLYSLCFITLPVALLLASIKYLLS